MLIDAGVPDYDIVTGTSPWPAIPLRYAQDAAIADPVVGLAYGDRAGAGTFLNDPYAGGSDATVAGGSDAIVRAGLASGPQHVSLGYSDAGQDRRERVDVQAGTDSSSGANWSVAGFSEQGTQGQDSTSLSTAFSASRFSYQTLGAERFTLDATADRGSYAFGYGPGTTASAWSDATATALLRPASAAGAFGAFSAQTSSGSYDSSGFSGVAAHTNRFSSLVGFSANADAYDVTAAVAAYRVGFTGPYDGQALSATLVQPLLRVSVTPPSTPFSFSAGAIGGYSTPTLLEQYAFGSASTLSIDRTETYQAGVSYSDGARVVAGVQALTQTVTGFDNGYANGLGGSLAWQITPQLAVRAWWMHAGFDQQSAVPPPRTASQPQPTDVASAWLSYESAGGLRADAIWRTDLVDWKPHAQLAGSLSGPLARRLRWFAGTEELQGTPSVNAGVTFDR